MINCHEKILTLINTYKLVMLDNIKTKFMA